MEPNNNLRSYLDNFDKDLESISSLVEFAKSAITFICEKKLYVEFLQYQAKEAANPAGEEEVCK